MNLQSIKVEKLKETWYFSSPSKLYDLCVDTIVKNIHILLVKNENDFIKCNNKKCLKSFISSAIKKKSIQYEKNSIQQSNDIDNCVALKLKNAKSLKISNKQNTTDQNLVISKQKAKYRHRHCRICFPSSGKHKNVKLSYDLKYQIKNTSSFKYVLRENIGPIPNCICQSIIAEYSKYYLKQLEQYEREQYFKIDKDKTTSNINKSKEESLDKVKPKKISLVNYYDLVMAMASRPDKCNLNILDYRQCIWLHSTLEQRLNLKNKPVKSGDEDEFDSSDLDENKMPKSIRSKQKPHFFDNDLKLIIKNQKHLSHLDMCPCMLTNKSILLINKYLNKNLKSLRLQNCCNWQLKSQSQQQQQQNAENNQQQNYHEQNNELNNDRLELHYFMDSDDEDDNDDDDDDDEDDDDDDDDDAADGDNHDNNLKLNESQANVQQNDYFNLRPYFVNNLDSDTNSFSGLIDVDHFMAELNEKENVIYKPEEDEDDDIKVEDISNDYMNKINKDLTKDFKNVAENNYYDDDDQDDFDNYLQEYVRQYQTKEENQNNKDLIDKHEKEHSLKKESIQRISDKKGLKKRNHNHHNHHISNRKQSHHRNHSKSCYRHHRDHHHHHHRDSQHHHEHHKICKHQKYFNSLSKISLANGKLAFYQKPLATIGANTTSECKLFEIDNQANVYSCSKTNSKNKRFECVRKLKLNEDKFFGKHLKNSRHYHHKPRDSKSHEHKLDAFEHSKSKSSKKRKLKKEKFGKSEENLEIKASINKSSKLDDTASNLSFDSLQNLKDSNNVSQSNQTITYQNPNDKTTIYGTNSTSATNLNVSDRTGSSILKWIVERTVSNSTITGSASVDSNLAKASTSSNLNSEQMSKITNSPSSINNTINQKNNETTKQQSLIERIKKKVTETKMIDKVSICSSNYDDYDLNNLNGGSKIEAEESASLNYDEISQISQYTNDNSSLNSKQDLYIHDEIKEENYDLTENKDDNNSNNNMTNETKNDYDSIDSSSSSSSTTSSKKSNNSSIYLSYDNNDDAENSSLFSSSSLTSSLMTSLSLRSSESSSLSQFSNAQCSIHSSSCCSCTSSSITPSNSEDSSSMFSDYDDNDLFFDNNNKSTNNLNDNDEAALKLLEKRYLRHNQEKLKEKKKSKSFLPFNKKKMSLNSIKNEFQQQNEKLDEQSHRKEIRQQKLLEKVANLGSSPINVIQSIAAKALNFKLKNSQNWASTSTSSTIISNDSLSNHAASAESAEAAASKQSLINYNRLLRQYKFLKSTNIKMNNQNEDNDTKNYMYLNQLVNNKILNSNLEDNMNSKRSNINKKLKINEEKFNEDDDDEEEIFNEKMIFFKSENNLEQMDHQETIENDTKVKKNEVVSDIEMEASTEKLNNNQPGTSKSFDNEDISTTDQNQQSSNLFSAIKFWMAKRVDSLSTSSTPNKIASTKNDLSNKVSKTSFDAASDLFASKIEDSSNTEKNDFLSKQKAKKKLKTIRSMSNFSLSATDSGDSLSISSNKSSHLAEFSSLTTSSSTFDSYNSIIETNSINKIFEEKFNNQNSESASLKENVAGTSTNLTNVLGNNNNNTNTNATASNNNNNNNNKNSDLVSLKSSKFKKKFEKLKKLNKIINQNNEMIETKLDIVDYNKNINNNKSKNQDKKSKSNINNLKSPKELVSQQLKNFLRKQKEKYDEELRLKNVLRLKKFSIMAIQTINLSQLQHLSLRNLGVNVIKRTMLNSLLKNFKCLKYLDISNCCTNQLHYYSTNNNNNDKDSKSFSLFGTENKSVSISSPVINTKQLVGSLDGLLNLAPTLTHLLIADLSVEDVQANLQFLLKLKQLKHLDVSNCREKFPLNIYKNPSLFLAKLVFHLTSIKSLDISGTNLGGSIIFKEQEEIDYIKKRLYEDLTDDLNDFQRVKLDEIETIKSGVSGLMFLNNDKKMLEFLGCFSCDNSVSSRSNLPAVFIAGEENEQHLYTSLETYMNDRPLFLLDALNHLFELYRDELVEDKLLGGHLIMNTMEKHLDNSRIQISGSASLFYVLKYWKEEHVQLPPFYLKRLIKTVINGMEEHIDESAMRRNCVLIMCKLNLPDDVLFVSDRLIKILLKIFDDYIEDRNKNPQNDRPEHFVLRTAMHLLNILACSVHGSDKSSVGSLAIPVAMNLIRTKTKFNEPDDILEVTWSFLWNITDETPENCEIFLDECDGMNSFMDCIKFNKSEIIRNMMGLLGNVSEVKHLRNRLCKNELIGTFRQLLFHANDGIEIPYNSAGVLVHIISEGIVEWLKSDCIDHDRQSVIEDIETAIDKWDLKSERNINYRSFEPIFRLVSDMDNPICQRWSSWALANLTTAYPDIYCPLFEKENGRSLLDRILKAPNLNDAVRRYINIVLQNVDNRNKQAVIQ